MIRRRLPWRWSLAALLIACTVAAAQDRPEFEIADIHLSPADGDRGGLLQMTEEGRVSVVANGRRVVDASGIQGTWDLTLTYRVRPRANSADTQGMASDPSGGVSLFEAVEQQLGLKLQEARRRMPVFVIDHIEETPTEN